MIVSIIFSTSYSLIGYYSSDKLALFSVGAVKADSNLYKQYYNIVEGLTLASGLPMPQLYIMNNPQINAFATGRDPKHSVICVTTGALEKLNKQELEGVLAHELSHVANYDIRFMTLTAVLIGMVSMISQIFLRSLWMGNRDSDNKNGGIFIVIGLVLAILSPILTTLVQLAISRKREYSADASAVKFTRSPTGLIGALTKIKQNSDMKVAGSIAPLFFAKPSASMTELFQTHPALEKRIEILKKM